MSWQNQKVKSHNSYDLNYLPTQQLRHLQHLMMTKQMKQAISILQLPVLELSSVISEELEQNPILECEEDEPFLFDEFEEFTEHLDIRKIDTENFSNEEKEPTLFCLREEAEKAGLFLENYYASDLTLFEFLMRQVGEVFENSRDFEIAEWIVGNLDDFGFLTLPLEELSACKSYTLPEIRRILEAIQTFDPPGIGAQNLRECLLIQLKIKGKEDDLAHKIIDLYYNEMTHNKIELISKSLKLNPKIIQKAIDKEIACLDLHPGLSYSKSKNEKVQTIVPDLFISNESVRIDIKINEENIPALKINSHYLHLLQDNDLSQETKQYIQTKIASGKWLLKSIEQRHSTLYRIAKEVAEIQKEFIFEAGELKPLTMKSIAEKLELNESTVARAIANKYVDCPKGMISLRSFFTNGLSTSDGTISANSVKDLVKKLIQEESKQKPLSDESISLLIKEKGIQCARRTVTKYRLEMEIPSASKRKNFSK